MEYAHPRPWHAGSLFVPGPRRVLGIGERCLWLARLEQALATGQITAAHYLVGRALLRLLGEDGRLDPGHDYLATLARCGRRTVQRALARLQEIGLVRWARRLVRTGWRAEQTSNAYELVPDGRPITPRAPVVQGSLRLHCGGQVGREDHFVRITGAAVPPIADPGRDLLAARRLAMEERWRQAPAGGR